MSKNGIEIDGTTEYVKLTLRPIKELIYLLYLFSEKRDEVLGEERRTG